MHVDLTPIFGQHRNAQAGIGFSMVLKQIDPACQGAQTAFCTPHSPRICHAEFIPMELQHSPDYVVHHLPDDELTGSDS